jgi:AraC-like DNA-binding protein
MNALRKERFDKFSTLTVAYKKSKQEIKEDAERKRLTYFERINSKYPNINPIPGEDLNIDNMIKKRFLSLWNDKVKYPTIKAICDKLGYSERHIYRLIKRYVH